MIRLFNDNQTSSVHQPLGGYRGNTSLHWRRRKLDFDDRQYDTVYLNRLKLFWFIHGGHLQSRQTLPGSPTVLSVDCYDVSYSRTRDPVCGIQDQSSGLLSPGALTDTRLESVTLGVTLPGSPVGRLSQGFLTPRVGTRL